MATIADLCLSKGISKIKLPNGTELYFHDRVKENAAPIILSNEINSEIPEITERMPTDDELLLYSTDAFDETREQRKQAILPPSQEK